MCRSAPYLASMGPEMRFLDKYSFVMKLTRGVSCMHDVLLCCVTLTGLPLQPCSNTELREGGHIDSFSLRLRMALKTLFHAQQRPGSPSLYLMPFMGQGHLACDALGNQGPHQVPTWQGVTQGRQASSADRPGGIDADVVSDKSRGVLSSSASAASAWADEDKIARLLSTAVAEDTAEVRGLPFAIRLPF
jgi:hypothetical protein